MRVGMVLLAAVLSCTAAHGQDTESGNYYLKHCKGVLAETSPNPYLSGTCMGVVQAVTFWGSELPDFQSCKPPAVTRIQSVRVLVRYLETHPDVLHENFQMLAAKAFREAWPCKK